MYSEHPETMGSSMKCVMMEGVKYVNGPANDSKHALAEHTCSPPLANGAQN